VQENAAAMALGPLDPASVAAIQAIAAERQPMEG
jgi:hypothetical protein